MLEVHDQDQSVTMLALKKGLKVSSFYYSLSKRFSLDFAELLAHANKYIKAKEWMEEKPKEKGERK